MRLNKKYANHRAELEAIVAYLSDESGAPNKNAIRLGVSADEVENLAALNAAFDAAYLAYSQPDTHTAMAVHSMRTADKNAFAVILPLRQRLKHGKAELTAADYASLGIHENKKTRTRAKIPTIALIPLLLKSEPLHLVFEAKTPLPDGAHRRFAVPKDGRIAREVAIVAQGAVAAEGDFRAIDSIGRSRFGISFSAAQVGMHCYLRVAVANRAGRGPMSPPVKAIII